MRLYRMTYKQSLAFCSQKLMVKASQETVYITDFSTRKKTVSMIEVNHERVGKHYTSFFFFKMLISKFSLEILVTSQQGFRWYLVNCKVFNLGIVVV